MWLTWLTWILEPFWEKKKWNNSAFTGGWLGWLGRQIFILDKTEKYWSFSKKKSTVFDFTSGWLGWLHFLGKKLRKKNMCYVPFNGWLGWLHFLRKSWA